MTFLHLSFPAFSLSLFFSVLREANTKSGLSACGSKWGHLGKAATLSGCQAAGRPDGGQVGRWSGGGMPGKAGRAHPQDS